MAADVRVITFNTAAGNPRITTPQEDFLRLPFYEEAFGGAEDAPLLALQEVGDAQARERKRHYPAPALRSIPQLCSPANLGNPPSTATSNPNRRYNATFRASCVSR